VMLDEGESDSLDMQRRERTFEWYTHDGSVACRCEHRVGENSADEYRGVDGPE